MRNLSFGGRCLAASKGTWLEMAHEAEQRRYAAKLERLRAQLAELEAVRPSDGDELEAWIDLEDELLERIEAVEALIVS